MIDIKANLENIEKVMELMTKYAVDEVSIDFLNIKKSKFKSEKYQASDEELLTKHLQPSPQEPWMSIPDSELESFTISGKIKE